MNPPSQAVRDLARQLLEASLSVSSSPQPADQPPRHPVVLICETLRASLLGVVGADGFNALLRRALGLARQDVPALSHLKIGPEGRLEGLEELAASAPAAEAAIALGANLLHLLITFIGEPLTIRLLRDAWPGAGEAPSPLNRGQE